MNNNNLKSIGERISFIRHSHGMTQEALAEQLEVSPKHISHIECGTSSLSLKSLIKVCKLFDSSLDYIVFGNSESKLISKLPPEIIDILSIGTKDELNRLNRYLQMYIELTQNRS